MISVLHKSFFTKDHFYSLFHSQIRTLCQGGRLPPELLSCLQQIIKIVNFVKTSALNIRLFANLCADLGSDHKCLLFYTEVRWLSRGNMTRRVFELRNELLEFYEERNHNFKNDLANTEFLLRLAYLSDIF